MKNNLNGRRLLDSERKDLQKRIREQESERKITERVLQKVRGDGVRVSMADSLAHLIGRFA